jgi:hypothetical protein
MTEVDDVIAITFEKAKSEKKCEAAAESLRSLYEGDSWEPSEILKVIVAAREADEAN